MTTTISESCLTKKHFLGAPCTWNRLFNLFNSVTTQLELVRAHSRLSPEQVQFIIENVTA